MRPSSLVLILTLFAGCRTSSLGTCSTDADCSGGGACDAVQRVCVATEAPQITAGYVDSTGRAFYDTVGPALSISANITGRSGVDPASVCLRVAGETGTCAHPGTGGAGSSYSFTVPRLTSPVDGSTPLDYTLTAASPSGKATTTSVQHLYFDGKAPAISVAADGTAYARTLPDGGAAPISVSVTIADDTGTPAPQLLSAGNAVAPSSATGNVYVFQLDPRDAPAGVEGPYSFHVRAVDRFGHDGGADGTRTIDDAAPGAVVKIYKGSAEPAAQGATYPAAAANTGWIGSTFVYNDTVHVKGTLTDVSGIASATLHVDGLELDGGTSAGGSRPLGCTAGATSCTFELLIPLNDVQNGAFHTGSATFDAGSTVGQIPGSTLRFVIEAQDSATASSAPAPHATSSNTAARTTRLLWYGTLGGAAVSGMAVHPSGDLIVTMDAGTAATVYDLAPDQPLTRWGVTLSASASSDGVIGTPAIGVGDAANARIYVASAIGDLYAIYPDGGSAWTKVTTANLFAVGPAITQADTPGGVVEEMVVPDGVVGGNSKLWRGTSASDVTSVASANRDFHAAPLILDGGVYFAYQTAGTPTPHLTRHAIAADGGLGAAVSDALASPGVAYFGLVTDGTNLYAATRPAADAGIVIKVDQSLALVPSWDGGVLADALSGEPTFGIDGKLYGGTLASQVLAFDAGTGSAAAVITLPGPGMTPLQGSDGRLYLPRRPSSLDALESNLLSWTFTAPNPVLRFATMDCAGRLFVASGARVYAFASDDQGLADTPWPSLRRDARNTGNAGALKYGIRTAPNTCNQ
jgi:hypothetical protein